MGHTSHHSREARARAAAGRWARRLDSDQRKTAIELADEIEQRGFVCSNDLFERFQSIGLPSYNMGFFLKIAQWSDSAVARAQALVVELLRTAEEPSS